MLAVIEDQGTRLEYVMQNNTLLLLGIIVNRGRRPGGKATDFRLCCYHLLLHFSMLLQTT